jgi:uncharacterized heparinase superfamily protein
MLSFESALLALRTARYLRASQILHRVRRRIRGCPAPRELPAHWNAQRAQQIARALGALGPVGTTTEVLQRVNAWRNGRVELLGLSQPVPVTWQEAAQSPLFAYHLHYHDALADAAWAAHNASDRALGDAVAAGAHAWIDSWSAGGSPAWDPYPIAVRAVNWLRMLAWDALDLRENATHISLARQIDVLERDIEWDLQANHLLRNTWALAIVPGCFEDAWAKRMSARGRKLFWRCLLDQVDDDGVHEERSPMYQARILRDALEVVAVSDALEVAVPASARARIQAMARALLWMRHDDGSLRLINDSAGDHGVDVARVLDAALGAEVSAHAPAGVWAPPQARFVAARADARSSSLFVDLGVPSPAHQPAHSHAGALSFEYEVLGRRVIVDGGCSGYDGDPWREYFRGTPAHSTVAIDGRNQSELWATFRVARRARVEGVRVSSTSDRVEIRARCRPYHLPGAAHERVLVWSPKNLSIGDTLPGAEGHVVESFLHVDPAWSAEKSGDSVVVLTQPSARVVLRIEGAPSVTIHRGETDPRCGWRATGFNRVTPSFTVRVASRSYDGGTVRMSISCE